MWILFLMEILLFLTRQGEPGMPGKTGTKENHAFYLSVIEVEYPVEESHTALRVKVFSDDLQNALSVQHGNKPVMIESLCSGSQEWVVAYLQAHIYISLDDNTANASLRECRQEGDSHWLTFEIGNAPWTDISIMADFFMEVFPTQTHMVSVTRHDSKRYARLTQKQKSFQLHF